MSALRKGWCPSVLRPMASGDGLIVRVSIKDGRVSPTIARALATLSRRFGNGLLDLSARANLQLRGVSDATLVPLQTELRALGVAEADGEPAVARNIISHPLAGIDPQAVVDTGSCVRVLRDRLAQDPIVHQLPQKFGFVIDDGGALSLANEKTDVSFLAQRGADCPRFLIRLAGQIAGECAIGELADVGLRIAHAFLQLRDEPAERMAALVRRVGIEKIIASAGLTQTALIIENHAPHPIGTYRVGANCVLGVGIPFGRLDASTLKRLADLAEASGGEMRLTPWRAILIVGADQPDAARLSDTGLIFNEDDPLRSVAACPGVSGCSSGTTATHTDARRLAPFARQLHTHGISLHVSGCAKGCAHPAAVPFTLVGHDGRYDLVRDGTAADKPIATGLEVHQLDLALQQFAEIDA
ncbi:MAG: precorrin-3B synthase [Methylovirgula sp.]|uniref:precorrin-3B synthase n=1 Tax=Methylovirgula sp. TaxID=1978224 RepID=UPI0030761F18